MARLGKPDGLSFEFKFSKFIYGWVEYKFYFYYDGETIANKKVLPTDSDGTSRDYFWANEDGRDTLIPFIHKILDTDKSDYWEPIEPDIKIAIYTSGGFPFLPSHYEVIDESEDLKKERQARKKLKDEKKKLPDDLFTVIIFVDESNFEDSLCWHGEGISLQLYAYRHELETFVAELELEYADFISRLNLKVDSTFKNRLYYPDESDIN